MFEKFTDRALWVVVLAQEEARMLNHNGAEHILLALLREGEGVAAQVLARLGADLSLVRQQVIEVLSGGHQAEAGATRLARPPGLACRGERTLLSQLGQKATAF